MENTSFLYRIADNFFQEYNSDIQRFTFVFPNRRAGLFFRKYLAEIAKKAIFSPEIITINECFASASELQPADRLSNLFKLYRIFIKHSGSEESFDSFVYWGEMLLADFDEVDKYLVDARQLFTNITELKEIEKIFNFFSERQLEAIRMFWKNFIPYTEEQTQKDFIATWKILYAVYEDFRNELINNGLATEGMISREVAEQLRNKNDIEKWHDKQFIFVGFNALNPCEKMLMVELQKKKMADFYWDYEARVLRDPENPASRFYAENIHIFPSKFEIKTQEENLAEKEIELIAVPSSVGMAKQTYAILNRLYTPEDTSWIDTAVVLPDENLLIPLLHSLPEQIRKVNVTMGYPLATTPLSGLLEHIFELQRRIRISGEQYSFYHQTVYNILNHQYINYLCKQDAERILNKMSQYNLIYVDAAEFTNNDLLSSIFNIQKKPANFPHYLLNILNKIQYFWKKSEKENRTKDIELEFLYQYYITINRMADMLKNSRDEIEMSLETLMKLIRQIIAGVTIPFVGEPLEGLQLMGVLETRGIDFNNLIICSFNEGIFPKKTQSNSFIPYNLRRAFGLPTYEHQDAITSYNFYRLIHRAKKIFLLYDSRTEGLQTGEVSRFYHQLYYHYGLNIRKRNIKYDISFNDSQNISIVKTPDVIDKLNRFLTTGENSKALSASAIKDYIDCPLQFYLTRIEEVEQTDEVQEAIEESMFGNIFHATMEYIYKPYCGEIIHKEDFDELIKNTLNIDKKIIQAFCEKYFHKKYDEKTELEGNNLLIAHVIRKYVIQVLKTDREHAPFRYIDSEKRCRISYPISKGNVNIKGFIDRIDEKDGTTRILDYKTGSGKLEFKSWDEVFEHNNDKRPKYVLQTFLYGILYQNEAPNTKLVPGIYYMKDVFKDTFVTELKFRPDAKTNIIIDDFSEYETEFRERLDNCLEEIFDPRTPFFQTTSTAPCKYCPYACICNRQSR
ncbi:MAG: PD-(D/E)XK nuclease family protein [Paludibacter sp.]|nr:PD-(D/E)XK nuclease family protein [Paludibacter sp.]